MKRANSRAPPLPRPTFSVFSTLYFIFKSGVSSAEVLHDNADCFEELCHFPDVLCPPLNGYFFLKREDVFLVKYLFTGWHNILEIYLNITKTSNITMALMSYLFYFGNLCVHIHITSHFE